ncbi:MAG TPA: UDP-N-acetylmuramate dehydrogenase [Mariprofundaceae bacterium]|nr:UDP-N-acetylmuramate dehydrogenase [Mariprofundaceae bacterium]
MSWATEITQLGRLDEQVLMSGHTTLAIGGPARWYFRPKGASELAKALRLIPEDLHILPLGRGSNLLITDEGFDGVVLDFGGLSEIAIDENTMVTGAGARMSKVAQLCATKGLAGLEFLATVPGDMGGGIAMNAGAFGQWVSDTLISIEVLHRNGEIESMMKEQLNMSYRHTELPSQTLVISGTFKLNSDDPEAIRERMRTMRKQRSSTQPLALPNCGSVFKNPEGDHAARLIEAVGLKGKKVGNARISSTHANFIVNEGQATSEDVLTLIAMAQQAVEKQFGVVLEPEVRILGGAK